MTTDDSGVRRRMLRDVVCVNPRAQSAAIGNRGGAAQRPRIAEKFEGVVREIPGVDDVSGRRQRRKQRSTAKIRPAPARAQRRRRTKPAALGQPEYPAARRQSAAQYSAGCLQFHRQPVKPARAAFDSVPRTTDRPGDRAPATSVRQFRRRRQCLQTIPWQYSTRGWRARHRDAFHRPFGLASGVSPPRSAAGTQPATPALVPEGAPGRSEV